MKRIFLLLLLMVFLLAACAGDDDDDNDASPDAGDDDDDDNNDDNDDDDNDTAPPDNPFLDPENPGPYAAGVRSYFLTDASRALSCGEGDRVLLTEVWYPADPAAVAELSENTVHDFFLGRWDEIEAHVGEDMDPIMLDLPTGAYRDAPPAQDAPLAPLLVFSHGFTSNRFQNYSLAAYLASHGYVVVSPDHICNSKVTLTPDAVVEFTMANVPLTLGERKGDVQFLIDVFTESPPEPFDGRIDTTRVALLGHSFGGITVTETFKIEPRAQAMLQMAAFGFPGVPETVTGPSMFFWGMQDKWMAAARPLHDAVIRQMPSPKYEMEFYATGHFAFSDLCLYLTPLAEGGNGCGTESRIDGQGDFTNPTPQALGEVIFPYVVAFFGASLFDEPSLAEYLATNHRPAMMTYDGPVR
jgi:dienelactone hydrolase